MREDAGNASNCVQLAEVGAISKLCNAMQQHFSREKLWASRVLGNIARECPDRRSAIAQHNGIQALTAMLKGQEYEMIAATEALGIIGSQSRICYAEIVEREAIHLVRALACVGSNEEKSAAENTLIKLDLGYAAIAQRVVTDWLSWIYAICCVASRLELLRNFMRAFVGAE